MQAIFKNLVTWRKQFYFFYILNFFSLGENRIESCLSLKPEEKENKIIFFLKNIIYSNKNLNKKSISTKKIIFPIFIFVL